MTGASKILTVSYGTFSCTLEGFDEPFNTMKAIAEYFRDLAAEDRYFGAEPPTPDAAMLHRIAEREIHRRVEAKIQDNGVILRAEELATTPALAPAATPALAAQFDPAPQISIPAKAPDRTAADRAAPTLSPEMAFTASGESVAARLSRLRSGTTAIESIEVAAVDLPDLPQQAAQEDYIEDQHAENMLNRLALSTPQTEADAPTPDSTAVLDALIDIIPTVAAAAATTAAPITTAEATPMAADMIETATPALADPVVATEPTASPAQPLATEAPAVLELPTLADLPALPETLIPAAAPAAIEAEIAPAIAETDLIDAAFEDAPPTALAPDDLIEDIQPEDAADIAAAEPELLADRLPENAFADLDPDLDADLIAALSDTTVQTPAATPVLIDTLYDDEADAFAINEPTQSAPGEDETASLLARLAQTVETPSEDAVVATLTAIPADPELAEESEDQHAVAEKLQRARARVIKIRRAEPQTQPDADLPALLSPEANAALRAELAALDDSIAAPAAPPARPTRKTGFDATDAASALEGRALLHTESGEDAVSRLIARTNSAMDVEENKRRHSAISHLKAAVAATEADRVINAANPERPAPDRQDAYRHDLQSVVRPKSGANADRPTPLVLVSEQRIDRPRTATANPPAARVVMPTRPQRTGARNNDSLIGFDDDDLDLEDALADDIPVNLFTGNQSFENFAARLGAVNLPEIMEAAAVYCAQILDRPQFSRTLVMTQLEKSAAGAALGREDCLRAFGTLLRQGRITKVQRGMFAVTDRSPILAESLRHTG